MLDSSTANKIVLHFVLKVAKEKKKNKQTEMGSEQEQGGR